MAALGDNNLNLHDISRRQNPDGSISTIIEQMSDEDPILDDMVVRVCNDGTNHISTIRTGLPTATWRQLNAGVARSKSQTAQASDTTGMLEAYSEVDKDLIDLEDNRLAARASEDSAFLESMRQTMATTLFYGDTTVNPGRFTGLAPRYATPAATKTASGYNMIDGGSGSSSATTSLWLIGWGDKSVHGLIPKGLAAGFNVTDLGEHTLVDENGDYYQGLRTHFKWNLGFTVRDWRYVVRICNIEVADLVSNSGAANLTRLMTQAEHRIQSLTGVRAVWYGNRTTRTYLQTQTTEKANVNLTFDNVTGKPIMHTSSGVPFRVNDALLNTETNIAGTFASV